MLELKNILYEKDNKKILNNINLKLELGKLVVITGANGSGKSTLAKIIMGIDKPTSGTIILNGQDITDSGIDERAKLGIGFAFQQPVRFKGLTVKDLLMLSTHRKLTVSELCDYLSQVGLCAKEYINRELNSSLSGGELKRIEIAMLVARATQFTIFDEPEAGIDLWSFNNLIQIFENLKSDKNSSNIIISHQERILNIADEIIILNSGEVVKKGNKNEMLPYILNESKVNNFYKGECHVKQNR